MRLLYLTAESYPTHRVDVELLFGKWLPAHGIASDLVAARADGTMDEVVWPAGRAMLGDSRGGWHRRIATLRHAVRQLLTARRADYDAIQVRDMPFVALFALVLARIKRLPFVYWMSYPIPEGHMGMALGRGLGVGVAKFVYHYLAGKLGGLLLYRVVLARADHVFVQSEQMMADVAARGVSPERMTPVPMGVDIEAIQAAAIAPSDDPRLLGRRAIVYLGTQVRPRRIELLFTMLAEIRREVPEALLVLVGDVEDEPHRAWLRQQAKAAGVADHVLWTGWLPMVEGWRYVRAAEVGLSPFPRGFLLDSASPTKVPEYLALGVPVVCNDNPDQAAIVAACGAGRCVPYTARDFAAAVLEIMRLGPDGRTAMIDAGKRYVVEHRDYRMLSAALASNYFRVLGRR